MSKLFTASLIAVFLLSPIASLAAGESSGDEAEQLRGIVNNLLDDNTAFAKAHKPDYYKPFAENQHPRATVVTCSDSRVHTHALDKTPDGDLFMVRNIGNQISTAEGSVEYGVHHLHTPLLIIIGHVACGAIKAVQGDYSKESEPIKRELDSIKLPAKNPKSGEAEEWLRGVNANVNNQVNFAMKKFTEEIKENKLTVIGAIYDFQNAMHQGQGRLVITNINGSTDAASVMTNLMKISGVGPGKQEMTGKPKKKTTKKPAVEQSEH